MPEEERLTFGPYQLDSRNAQLWRGKQLVPLTGKALGVLQYLAERPGQLVTKEALLAGVWPGVVVSDTALTARIRELRLALRESAQQPRYIQTVHRRGFRFIGAGGPPPRIQESHPAADHFVGRAAELTRLHDWMAKALGGERHVVFVTGEAGIGKTTLVDALLHDLSAAGAVWIGRGQCIEQYGEGEAYLPVLEALGQLARGAARPRVVKLLKRHAPTWLAQMPGLVAETERNAVHRKAGATRDRMLREITEAIEGLAAVRPVVLVCEDLQWSDHATLDLITYLAQRREGARLLVIGTYRPAEFATREHPIRRIAPDLHAHGRLHELALRLLARDHVEEYLRWRLPSGPPRTGLADHIHRATEGNPLFVVNLVEYLLQRELLVETEGQWRCTVSVEEAGVPDELRQMIERRVEGLAPFDRDVLEIASVAGTEFAVASVAAGHDGPLEAMEAACDAIASKHDLLEARGVDEWPDGTLSGRYRFRHVLYQNALYGRMAEARRIRLHRAIGERREAGYRQRTAEIAVELAAHFERARDHRRAVQYRQQAADTAVARSAYWEAVAHLAAGVALVEKLPDLEERLDLELMLQATLGPALMTLKGYADPAVERAYRRARELCEQTGQAPLLFRILPGLRGIHHARGEVRASRAVAEEHLALAEAVGQRGLMTWAHYGMGETALSAGECEVARVHLQSGIDAYEIKNETVFYTVPIVQSPGVACLTNLAWALWLLGYPDQAIARREEAMALAEELAHPFSLGFALVEAIVLHEVLGETPAMRRRGERLMALSQSHGFPLWMAAGVMFEGATLVDRGQVAGGLAQLKEGLTVWRSLGMAISVPYFLSLVARAYGASRQNGAGLETIAEALERLEQTGERIWEAELYRLRGQLILDGAPASPAADAHARAEECFAQARAIARRQGARSLELRAVTSLARSRQQRGDTDVARRELKEICDTFTEGFDTADVRQARTLLKTLSPAAGP